MNCFFFPFISTTTTNHKVMSLFSFHFLISSKERAIRHKTISCGFRLLLPQKKTYPLSTKFQEILSPSPNVPYSQAVFLLRERAGFIIQRLRRPQKGKVPREHGQFFHSVVVKLNLNLDLVSHLLVTWAR